MPSPSIPQGRFPEGMAIASSFRSVPDFSSAARTAAEGGSKEFAGAHSEEAKPVPIPNTVVKLFTPMVLVKAERVGRARLFHTRARESGSGQARKVKESTLPGCAWRLESDRLDPPGVGGSGGFFFGKGFDKTGNFDL